MGFPSIPGHAVWNNGIHETERIKDAGWTLREKCITKLSWDTLRWSVLYILCHGGGFNTHIASSVIPNDAHDSLVWP